MTEKRVGRDGTGRESRRAMLGIGARAGRRAGVPDGRTIWSSGI